MLLAVSLESSCFFFQAYFEPHIFTSLWLWLTHLKNRTQIQQGTLTSTTLKINLHIVLKREQIKQFRCAGKSLGIIKSYNMLLVFKDSLIINGYFLINASLFRYFRLVLKAAAIGVKGVRGTRTWGRSCCVNPSLKFQKFVIRFAIPKRAR